MVLSVSCDFLPAHLSMSSYDVAGLSRSTSLFANCQIHSLTSQSQLRAWRPASIALVTIVTYIRHSSARSTFPHTVLAESILPLFFCRKAKYLGQKFNEKYDGISKVNMFVSLTDLIARQNVKWWIWLITVIWATFSEHNALIEFVANYVFTEFLPLHRFSV